MQLKLDDSGHVVVADGKPVYVHDDGKEIAFDAVHTAAKIRELNHEAKTHREAKEQAIASLQAYEGIDPEEARKAFEKIKNYDDQKLANDGQLDRIKKEAADAYEERLKAVEKKYKPVVEERDSYKARYEGKIIDGAFAESEYIKGRVQSPLSLIRAAFKPNFAIEDDRLVGRDASGNRIYSRVRPGELAEFNEAIEILIDSHPDRDGMLKGTGMAGGGANGSRMGADGKRTVSRAAFDKMGDSERQGVIAEVRKGTTTLID